MVPWLSEMQTYQRLLRQALRGQYVKTRDGEAFQRQNVLVELDHLPAYRVRPGMSTAVLQVETLSLISGRAPAERICEVAPQLARFRDDRNQFSGMYGPRIKDQLPEMVELLMGRPATRQAVLSIFQPHDIAGELHGVRDTPCTTSLIFSRRKLYREYLDVTAVMRSQDLWWGYPYDVLMFAALTRTIAHCCGLHEGRFALFVANQHVYDRHGAEAADVVDQYVPAVAPASRHWAPLVAGRGDTPLDRLHDGRSRAMWLLLGAALTDSTEWEQRLLTSVKGGDQV